METTLLGLALFTLGAFIFSTIVMWFGHRTIKSLDKISPPPPTTPPKVSILIAARNEEKHLAAALQSVLLQDYGNFEVIVVNDRSTDRTGEILDRLAHGNGAIRPIHVTRLPPGWLGKNHALYRAAQEATGQLLLFTDADVVMHPATLRQAVHYLLVEQFDHLTLSPAVKMPTAPLKLFAGFFNMAFFMYTQPWKVRNPRSDKFIGIGAFNLIRASTYHAMGTHQAIAMRPDDDMKLGKLVKQHGFKSEFAHGTRLIHVEWYDSLAAVVKGLEKNLFAGLDYNLWAAVQGTIANFIFWVWPFAGGLLTAGPTQILNLAIMVIILLIYGYGAGIGNLRRWYGIGVPLAALFFIFLLWNSTLKTLINRGIYWRETFYPLAELKANKV